MEPDQGNLFPPPPLLYTRLARASDPETSHEAASKAKVAAARQRALQALRRHPGFTASEIEAAEGVPGREVGRRLVELERLKLAVRGEARVCRITGTRAATWSAK